MTVQNTNAVNSDTVRSTAMPERSLENAGSGADSDFASLMIQNGGTNFKTGSGDDTARFNDPGQGPLNADTGSGDDNVEINSGQPAPGPAPDPGPEPDPGPAPEEPIAANEYGRIHGDPHFIGGDGGKYDVMGEDGKTYSLLTDTGLDFRGQFKDRGDGNTYVVETGLTVTGQDGSRSDINFKQDGTATINGQPMEQGRVYDLADGGTAKLDGNTLAVTTAEGYTIQQQAIDNRNIDTDVYTGENGVGNGQDPGGLLGQSFDADDVARNGSGEQGEGAIDGVVQDYETDGLFMPQTDPIVDDNGAININTGSGDDEVIINAGPPAPDASAETDDSADTGTGTDADAAVDPDAVSDSGTTPAHYTGTSDDDEITIEDPVDGPLNIDTGSGDDTVVIDAPVDGPLVIDTGSGDDTIIINGPVNGPIDIDTGSGDDTIIINGEVWNPDPESLAPVAANETATVSGTSSFRGGDDGLYDVPGEAGKIYNFLSDTGIELRGRLDAYPGEGDSGENTVVSETGLTVGEGMQSDNINFRNDGTAQINGQLMVEGQTYQLADGGTAILENGELSVTAAEGYTIKQSAHGSGDQAFIDIEVSTGENGVDNGRMPDGLLGQSFDADDEAITSTDAVAGNISDYERPALDPINDNRGIEETAAEAPGEEASVDEGDEVFQYLLETIPEFYDQFVQWLSDQGYFDFIAQPDATTQQEAEPEPDPEPATDNWNQG